nr:ribonuclease H-like domain-containing protein [Tanacetum cinerariifolium]
LSRAESTTEPSPQPSRRRAGSTAEVTTILTQSPPPPPLQTDPQTHTEPTTPANPTPINSSQLNSPQSEPSPIQQPSPQPLDIPNQPPTEPPRTHRMVTRSQSGIVKPIDRLSLHITSISQLPKSPFLALQNPHWNNAMHDEYNALVKNGTGILVPRPLARLVANGSSHKLGIDCDETFSPMVKPATIRTVLSLAVSRKWPIHQLNVKNAFLNGDLSETVYMRQPPGFVDPRYPHHVMPLVLDFTTAVVTLPYSFFVRDLSAEAEYRVVANVVAETAWLRNLFRELHSPLSAATLVYCDNVSATYLSANPVQHQRTKHIEIDIHFVRDLVTAGQVRVLHVPSRYQYADIFTTKGLPSSLFEDFRSSLSIKHKKLTLDAAADGAENHREEEDQEGNNSLEIETLTYNVLATYGCFLKNYREEEDQEGNNSLEIETLTYHATCHPGESPEMYLVPKPDLVKSAIGLSSQPSRSHNRAESTAEPTTSRIHNRSLNDLDNETLHIDGQSMEVDAPPDIIDLDEDDDIIDDEDVIPHDLADSYDEDLVNVDDDDGVDVVILMSADVARGHGGDGGGDDRKGIQKPNLGGRKAGRLHTRQETRNLGLKKITDDKGPVPIRFEWDDKKTLMPLGDHSSHWSNYLGELIREMPLYYPSWQKVLAERKATILTKIGTQFDLTPHMQSRRWTDINAGIQQHLQKLYNTNKASLKMESSATREYPSLIHTFFVTHTVNEEEMLRLQALGSNTPSGVPYTEEEINAFARKGKQRGHLPVVGRVLQGRVTDVLIPPPSPPPQCTHNSDDVEKLKKKNKYLTKQVNLMMKLFRSDDKFSQMLNQYESTPEFGNTSGGGGCGDDEMANDEDGSEDEEDEEDGDS